MHEPPRKNLAARMGGWSARHRWAALGLWFAFVIAAIAGGTAAGQINIPDARLGDGQSGHVNRLIDDAGFDKHANEMVLVQSDSLTVHDSAFRAAIGDTVRTLAQTDNVTNIEDPLNGDSANVSKDGHSALVRFDVPGDETELETRIVPIMDRIEGVQKQNPDVSVRQFGDASAAHTMKEMSDSDLKKAGNLSLPLTMIILFIAFGALVAAGIPVLLAFSAVLADVRPELDRQPPDPDGGRRPRGDPDDRYGGRRRLLAVLPAAGAARAGGHQARRHGRASSSRQGSSCGPQSAPATPRRSSRPSRRCATPRASSRAPSPAARDGSVHLRVRRC